MEKIIVSEINDYASNNEKDFDYYRNIEGMVEIAEKCGAINPRRKYELRGMIWRARELKAERG